MVSLKYYIETNQIFSICPTYLPSLFLPSLFYYIFLYLKTELHIVARLFIQQLFSFCMCNSEFLTCCRIQGGKERRNFHKNYSSQMGITFHHIFFLIMQYYACWLLDKVSRYVRKHKRQEERRFT